MERVGEIQGAGNGMTVLIPFLRRKGGLKQRNRRGKGRGKERPNIQGEKTYNINRLEEGEGIAESEAQR